MFSKKFSKKCFPALAAFVLYFGCNSHVNRVPMRNYHIVFPKTVKQEKMFEAGPGSYFCRYLSLEGFDENGRDIKVNVVLKGEGLEGKIETLSGINFSVPEDVDVPCSSKEREYWINPKDLEISG